MNFNMRFFLRAGIVIAVLAALYFLLAYVLKLAGFTPDRLLGLVREAGPWGPLVYILLFIFSPGIPASVLAIASGATFGMVLGLVYSWIGATLAMIPPFWFARLLGRKPLEKLLSRVGGSVEDYVEKFQCSVQKRGWRFVATCRLIPLFPFGLLNLVFGLTRINFWTYLWTSSLFVIPGITAFVYIGYTGYEAASGNSGIPWRAFIPLTVLGLLACLPQIIRRLRGQKPDDDCS